MSLTFPGDERLALMISTSAGDIYCVRDKFKRSSYPEVSGATSSPRAKRLPYRTPLQRKVCSFYAQFDFLEL